MHSTTRWLSLTFASCGSAGIVRVVLGVALGAATFTALTGAGIWHIVAGIVGTPLLVTGTVGFCPLYALLRMNTRRGTSQQFRTAAK